ncbi:TetR/AcrR family transcriptional regulator [Kribbella antibiotica]|uniref:TetR/AcrR family transcriptional regulator n=1 Tax=Kribbella antibiotica TaxID=190195 RepID=A0A4R4ZL43_9ACTN|nr:TetR/AcrR family transcriptional regulator [Kribbella antibiotica]TDD58564.1 TetR/AcrR family transcriptional regulator [Kribbella antibiotica]
MASIGRRRALSQDEVLDAALALLDQGGPAAASIRGIAAKVGVAPNAVYTYFPDKAAVTGALVERLLGASDHGAFADPTRPWRERVEALATDLRERMVAHPGAAALLMSGPMDGPRATAIGEQLQDLLIQAGLDEVDAARATYLLIVFVLGSIALEVADEAEPGPLPSEADRIASRRRVFDQIPPEDFPRSAAAAPTMATYISTEQYLWGLHRVLDGISPRP